MLFYQTLEGNFLSMHLFPKIFNKIITIVERKTYWFLEVDMEKCYFDVLVYRWVVCAVNKTFISWTGREKIRHKIFYYFWTYLLFGIKKIIEFFIFFFDKKTGSFVQKRCNLLIYISTIVKNLFNIFLALV